MAKTQKDLEKYLNDLYDTIISMVRLMMKHLQQRQISVIY